jgi:hypothetical protein
MPEEDEDNTLLWIALGGALVFFLMRMSQSQQPAPQPQIAAPKSAPNGVTVNPDGSISVGTPTIPDFSNSINMPTSIPLNPNIPTNPSGAGSGTTPNSDPIFGIADAFATFGGDDESYH